MSTPRTLRPYQAEAAQAVTSYWAVEGRERYTPVVVLPTGTGKSTVIAKLAADAYYVGLRVVMLAHRRELLDQMAASVNAVAPELPRVGIVQGERNSPTADIVAASFQTLTANPARLAALGRREVVLVDEMHHSAAETYKGVLDALDVTEHNPNNPVFACGFTATASRADGGLVDIWDNVVYEKSLSWAIKKGYLVTPRGLTVVLPDMDLTEVTVRAGDYAAGELEHVMQASVDTTVMAMLTHAAGRASIVFAAGVDHAEALAAALSAHGVAAAAVTGAMSAEARAEVYAAFNDGELDAMVTVQVLTEGADFPRCDAVVMARPTRSQTLYSQMVGRALRLYPGKDDALVLDLAGVTRDMSLVTLSDLTTEATTARVSPDSDDDPGQDEPAPRPERKQRIGVAALEDIDLLAVSPANWLTTPKGVRFLDVGNKAVVFLWPPHPDTAEAVKIGVMHTPPAQGDGWLFDGVAGELADAVEAAEHAAWTYGTLPARQEPWRNRSTPSAAQVRLAKTLGVDHADDKTRARLSDDISTALAARRLDPFVS